MPQRWSFARSDPVPDRLELSVGDEVAIERAGMGTAGYRWREQVDGEPGVVTVAWHTAPVSAEGPPTPGLSAAETATIHAAGVGEVRVVLLQGRPWESTVEPVMRIAFTVSVAPPS